MSSRRKSAVKNTRGTTQGQLSDTLSRHYCTAPFFGDVTSANEIPLRISSYPAFFIVNSDESWKDGTHWMLLAFPGPASPAIYFDPLGKEPSHYSSYIANYLKIKSHPFYYMNRAQYQPTGAASCGQFCVYVADRLCRGDTYGGALSTFDTKNLSKNNKMVLKYYNDHMQKQKG